MQNHCPYKFYNTSCLDIIYLILFPLLPSPISVDMVRLYSSVSCFKVYSNPFLSVGVVVVFTYALIEPARVCWEPCARRMRAATSD